MRPRARWPAVALAATAGLAVAACSSSGSRSASGPVPSSAASSDATTQTRLQVPPGLGGGAFSATRTLTVPKGWTAGVWARVDAARMEAWTPQGDLLVSQPGNGTVVELTPHGSGAPTSRTVLSGLTTPQGLAFAQLDGHAVLYVGESDEIDRYAWNANGISGSRTVVAGHLPDQDPSGDDVHR